MTNSIPLQARLIRNPSILHNDFDDGVMMMDIDSGLYFDVDSIGGQIWALLEQPSTLEAICTALAEDYDVDPETCREETAEFLGDLLAKDLIRHA